jgi:hypothetical protein
MSGMPNCYSSPRSILIHQLSIFKRSRSQLRTC